MPKRKRSEYGFSDYSPSNNRRPSSVRDMDYPSNRRPMPVMDMYDDDDESDDYDVRNHYDDDESEYERRPRTISYNRDSEDKETDYLINLVGLLVLIPACFTIFIKIFG
jgi:hypothetical protein